MDDQSLDRNNNLDNIVLALLFAAEEPLSIRRMSAILEDVSGDDVRVCVEGWRRRLDDEAWSIAIEQVAGGYQLITRAEFAPFVGRLYSKRRKLRLSRAGLETLAIIAYKQPVTRADIESIRGVGSGGVIANLMERSLVKITGKARVLGAPFLYGTTPEFLEYLGLNSLKDLPSLEELEALLEKEAYPEGAEPEGVEPEGAEPEGVEGAEPAEVTEEAAVAAAQQDDADELFEATAAEVAAAMAAVAEARESLPPKPKPDPAAAETPPSPESPAEADAEAPAEATAGAATLGPPVEEPLNQPLATKPGSDEESEDAQPAEPAAASLDDREEDR